MSTRSVWGVIIIVLSIGLFLYGGYALIQIFNADSAVSSSTEQIGGKSMNLTKEMYKAMGVDLDRGLLKWKLIYGGLMGLSVIGAIVGTKLLQNPARSP